MYVVLNGGDNLLIKLLKTRLYLKEFKLETLAELESNKLAMPGKCS